MVRLRRAQDARDLRLTERRAGAARDATCGEPSDDRPLREPFAREAANALEHGLLALVDLEVETVRREPLPVGHAADALATCALLGERRPRPRPSDDPKVRPCEVDGAACVRSVDRIPRAVCAAHREHLCRARSM